jgi:hypothetical protein
MSAPPREGLYLGDPEATPRPLAAGTAHHHHHQKITKIVKIVKKNINVIKQPKKHQKH